jgi:hypothetical protein
MNDRREFFAAMRLQMQPTPDLLARLDRRLAAEPAAGKLSPELGELELASPELGELEPAKTKLASAALANYPDTARPLRSGRRRPPGRRKAQVFDSGVAPGRDLAGPSRRPASARRTALFRLAVTGGAAIVVAFAAVAIYGLSLSNNGLLSATVAGEDSQDNAPGQAPAGGQEAAPIGSYLPIYEAILGLPGDSQRLNTQSPGVPPLGGEDTGHAFGNQGDYQRAAATTSSDNTLYAITGQSIAISATGNTDQPIGQIDPLGPEPVPGSRLVGLLADNGQLIVLVEGPADSASANDGTGGPTCKAVPTVGAANYTFALIYDIDDPATPRLIEQHFQSGAHADNLLIDADLWLVTSYQVASPASANLGQPSSFVPCSGNAESLSLVPPGQITQAPEVVAARYAVISAIDLARAVPVDVRAIFGAANP